MSAMAATKLTYEVSVPNKDKRLRELIIYIAGRCLTNEFFGTVKLNKILFHSDFRAFRKYGKPITGQKYKKDERGPVPVHIKPVQMEMEKRHDILVIEEEVYGLIQRRVVPLRQPDLTVFTGQDIAVVDEIIKELWNKTATQVSAESHGIQWNTRVMNDPIPYEAAYLSDEPITPAEIERTAALHSKYKWASAT